MRSAMCGAVLFLSCGLSAGALAQAPATLACHGLPAMPVYAYTLDSNSVLNAGALLVYADTSVYPQYLAATNGERIAVCSFTAGSFTFEMVEVMVDQVALSAVPLGTAKTATQYTVATLSYRAIEVATGAGLPPTTTVAHAPTTETQAQEDAAVKKGNLPPDEVTAAPKQ